MEGASLLLRVLWSPGEAMFLISKRPRVLAPLIFLSVCALLVGIVTSMKVNQGELTLRLIERSQRLSQMPQEAKDRMVAQANSPGSRIGSYAAAIVFPPLIVTIIAAMFFGIFTIFGRESGFKAFLAVTAFAFVPSVFSQLASLLTLFIVPQYSIMLDELGSLSPAVFLERDLTSPVLFQAVSRIDVVTIWIMILLVIGYGFLLPKGVSKVMRGAVVVAPFLVYTGLRLAVAYLTGV